MFLLGLLANPADRVEAAFAQMRSALAVGTKPAIEGLFLRPADAGYLFEMAGRVKGIKALSVNVVPSPPGWEKTGRHWAVFHMPQSIEQDHDTIYPLVETAQGLKLGHEIPQTVEAENRILSTKTQVHLILEGHQIDVACSLKLGGKGSARADILRLQDDYTINSATVDGVVRKIVKASADGIPSPQAGELLRVGSLIIPWSAKRSQAIDLRYGGGVFKSPTIPEQYDWFDDKACYLTAWWVPSTACLPAPSDMVVTGPKAWEIRSEGLRTEVPAGALFPPSADEQTVAYRCPVPISFPKVVAGAYVLAASLTQDGRTYRSYGFAPVDTKRAETVVRKAAEAGHFYEAHLGKFPFPGYDVFDSQLYAGIESYSYTLLPTESTLVDTTHEMGHTYFGGLVPCPYVRDTWNEGITQYVDSVLLKRNSDGTLETALKGIDNHVPLTQMPIAWGYDGANYMRGAYAMTMLAHEIGQEAVYSGLRALIAGRQGKDTVWSDLRPYFERASGQKLDWFWSQWISGGQWPTLRLVMGKTEKTSSGFRTKVELRQTGTSKPFRLRFLVHLSGGTQSVDREVRLNAASQITELTTAFRPTKTALKILGYTFAEIGR